MANYQNNMRYGRQNNMRQMRPACGNYGSSPAARTEKNASCGRFGQDAPHHTQNTSPWRDSGCNAPAKSDAECKCDIPCQDVSHRNECGHCTSVPAADCGCAVESDSNSSCGRRRKDPLSKMPLAMAYVPWQTWEEIYEICEGFQAGTIFAQLDKQFLGRGGWKQ